MMSPVDFSNNKQSFLRRLCAALFKPVDISFLIFFRILFCGIMLWEVCRYFMHDWITRYYVDPLVTFTYYGFSWVKPCSTYWWYRCCCGDARGPSVF
jgi:hypothetical protein